MQRLIFGASLNLMPNYIRALQKDLWYTFIFSSGSDEGDESKGQKSTGTVSKRSALRAKKRLKKEDTDGSSKNKTVTSKGEKDEGRKCKDSTPSTPKEERRKRKPDSTGDSPPHSQSDLPELPKRCKFHINFILP